MTFIDKENLVITEKNGGLPKDKHNLKKNNQNKTYN